MIVVADATALRGSATAVLLPPRGVHQHEGPRAASVGFAVLRADCVQRV